MLKLKLTTFAFLAAATLLFTALATPSKAQCRDPWVGRAVSDVAKRTTVYGSNDDGECDYRRYGGGHWSSYADLVNKVKLAGICNNRTITQAYKNVAGRPPMGFGYEGECNPALYWKPNEPAGSTTSSDMIWRVQDYLNAMARVSVKVDLVFKPRVNPAVDANAIAAVLVRGNQVLINASVINGNGSAVINGNGSNVINGNGSNVINGNGSTLTAATVNFAPVTFTSGATLVTR